MNETKEYGIHDFYESRWKRRPVDVLRERKIDYIPYVFYDGGKAMGVLYVYKTDPLTNILIYNDIGVTDFCPIAEVEIDEE